MPHTDSNKFKQQQENLRQKAFTLVWQLAIIIALPAIAGAYLGHRFDMEHASGKKYTIIFSAIAFLISWIIIIRKYIEFNKQVKKVRQDYENLPEEYKKEIKNKIELQDQKDKEYKED